MLFTIVCILQFWRQVYLVTVLALILAVFSAQVHPLYLSQEWKLLRSALFCSVAAFGVLPACHWVWLNGGFGTEIVQVTQFDTVFRGMVEWSGVSNSHNSLLLWPVSHFVLCIHAAIFSVVNLHFKIKCFRHFSLG